MLALLAPTSVRADDTAKPTLAGSWGASAMKEQWSTSEWGDACGPKPAAGGGAGAGTVTVTETGSELAFSGAGRSFTTAQCWETMPGLVRTSHSSGKRGWASTCASPPGDPRQTSIVTRISATDDTIVFAETGTFQFHIKDTACRASVSRSRSFKLQQRSGEAPAPSASASGAVAPPPPPPRARPQEPIPPYEPREGCEPGAPPARFEVRPTRKLVRPGDSFELDVRVFDARGCRLGVTPELRVDAASALASKIGVDKQRVSVAADAPEGRAELSVAVGGKSVQVTLEVTPAEKYGELLRTRGLNERGEDESPAVAEIESSIGGAPSTAEDSARTRRITFLAIVGGVAALLGIVALALVRRGKHRPDAQRMTEAPPPPNVTFFETDQPSAAMECPKCGRVFASGSGFCATDGSALVPSKASPPAPPPLSEPPPPGIEDRPRARPAPEKICPNCGDRFAADAGFCGKDGTHLVPIN